MSSLPLPLPLPLLSSLLATKHCDEYRSTNTAANFEAFECDLAHGRCTAVGSLPPSLPSLLPSLPLLLKKRRGNFLLQEYFRRGIYFYYSFKLIPKKTPPGEITGVTDVLALMDLHGSLYFLDQNAPVAARIGQGFPVQAS